MVASAEPAGSTAGFAHRAGGSAAEHQFRVDARRLADTTDRDAALERADRVVAGEYQAYGWEWRALPDAPADWLRHPVTGHAFKGSIPWWEIRHLDPEQGDIMDLWEPARFAWAYDLVRGYLLTGEDRYAAAFHRRLAEWRAVCPPYRGPHWSCGQESSIRAAALLYAEANLADAPASTPEAMERLALVLAATGERVEDAIGYAVSQRNNHAISEATGLILLGVRFRDRHPSAGRWLRQGRALLERLVREQFAADGWYIQHSFNYTRLALDQCVVAQRALRAAGEPSAVPSHGLSAGAVERLAAAVDLLGWVMEPNTGVVPNHGANDGALVHPATLADYRDFRPALTAVCASFDIPLPGHIDPDVETLAWLGLDAPAHGPPPEDGVRTGSSGWAVARVGATMAFLRAGRYGSRPGHIDPLHLDVRFQTSEAIVDPGTFSYNAPPLDRAFASASAHNGPIVDGREPGLRGPRFLWLAWPEARVIQASWQDQQATIVAELPGRVRRTVRVREGEVRVEDDVLLDTAEEITIRWLLHPTMDPAGAELPPDARRLESRPDGAAGWFSPRYGQRLAAPCFEVSAPADAGALVSTFVRVRGDGS